LIRWRGGDPRAALAAFDAAVRADPRNARALVWMGMVHTNLGQTADALAAFQRATRADPTDADAWIGIANAQMNRHDVDAASAALSNAQHLQPGRPVVKETERRLDSLRAEAGGRGHRPDR
jgi:cytochrome c-type biogenesis protein CcmH/NrfG